METFNPMSDGYSNDLFAKKYTDLMNSFAVRAMQIPNYAIYKCVLKEYDLSRYVS